MAEWTGLEPATPGVTGRYSNQLNYHSSLDILLHRSWIIDSVQQLENSLLLASRLDFQCLDLVGAEGFEPPTLAL